MESLSRQEETSQGDEEEVCNALKASYYGEDEELAKIFGWDAQQRVRNNC